MEPASYEHFIETLRQGSAGALRVAAAARVLQREAHKTSTFAKVLDVSKLGGGDVFPIKHGDILLNILRFYNQMVVSVNIFWNFHPKNWGNDPI